MEKKCTEKYVLLTFLVLMFITIFHIQKLLALSLGNIRNLCVFQYLDEAVVIMFSKVSNVSTLRAKK